MKETFKQYLDDFNVLPNMVKGAIVGIITLLIIFCLAVSISNSLISKKVEKLEKQNVVLKLQAEKALANAENFARAAADEHIRATNLESQLPKIEKKIINSDEKISNSQNNSNSISADIDDLRRRDAKRSNSSELRKRIETRYGNSNRR